MPKRAYAVRAVELERGEPFDKLVGKLQREGLTLRQIGMRLGISHQTVWRNSRPKQEQRRRAAP